MKYLPFSATHDSLFNVFANTFHVWVPSLPFAKEGRARDPNNTATALDGVIKQTTRR
jgi:hypothetical protein